MGKFKPGQMVNLINASGKVVSQSLMVARTTEEGTFILQRMPGPTFELKMIGPINESLLQLVPDKVVKPGDGARGGRKRRE